MNIEGVEVRWLSDPGIRPGRKPFHTVDLACLSIPEERKLLVELKREQELPWSEVTDCSQSGFQEGSSLIRFY